jgi:hypothetical protein
MSPRDLRRLQMPAWQIRLIGFAHDFAYRAEERQRVKADKRTTRAQVRAAARAGAITR